MNWVYHHIIAPINTTMVYVVECAALVMRNGLQPIANLFGIRTEDLIVLMEMTWLLIFAVALFSANPLLFLLLVGFLLICKK